MPGLRGQRASHGVLARERTLGGGECTFGVRERTLGGGERTLGVGECTLGGGGEAARLFHKGNMERPGDGVQ